MHNVTFPNRLRAMVLGIRPSVIHTHGLSAGVPVDNLTEVGIEAWGTGLWLLASELEVAAETSGPVERWMLAWIHQELAREYDRWTDPSSALRLMMLALSASGSPGPSGAFWIQWRRNLEYLRAQLERRVLVPTPDTTEFADHCVELVAGCGGPERLREMLRSIAELGSDDPVDRTVFRPLASSIERVRLGEIVAASFAASSTACTAVESRLFDPGAHHDGLVPCGRPARSGTRRLARPMSPGSRRM